MKPYSQPVIWSILCSFMPSCARMEKALLNRLRAEPGSIVGSSVGRAGVGLERVEPAAGVEKLTVGNEAFCGELDGMGSDVSAGNGVRAGDVVDAVAGEKLGNAVPVLEGPQ